MRFDNATIMELGNVLLYTSFPAIILFTVFYGIRSRWRTHQAGRALFYSSLALSAIITLSMAALLFGGQWPGRAWVRLLVYGFLSVTFWRMLVTLLHIQSKSKDDRAA